MKDQWYFDVMNAAKAQDEELREDARTRTRESLVAAGAGQDDRIDDFDLAAMDAKAATTNGEFNNENLLPHARQIGRRDVRTRQSIAGPQTEAPDIWAQPVPAAAAAVARTGARGVYEFGRGVWNFSADLYEWMGGEGGYRPPSFEEVGGGESSGLMESMASEIVKYGIGFTAATARLSSLAAAPRSSLGKATGMGAQGMAAGAVTDFVVGDPRYDSVYDAVSALAHAENEVVGRFTLAQMAETPGGAMAGRAGLAAEGALIGAIVGPLVTGGPRAMAALGEKGVEYARALWLRGDELEDVAVQGLSRARYTFDGGLSEADAGWLGVWMAARIAKGERTLTDGMKEAVRGSGATEAQAVAAFNAAARMAQQARAEALVDWSQTNADLLEQGTAHLRAQSGH